jgi:hypothetical protein
MRDVSESQRPVSAEARGGQARRVVGAHGREGDCWQRCGAERSGASVAGVADWYAKERPAYAGPRIGDVGRGPLGARTEIQLIDVYSIRVLNPSGRLVDVLV